MVDEDVVAKLKAEQTLIEELNKGAAEQIEAAQEDPTQQEYLQRLDTRRLVKSDEEFAKCLSSNIPMRQVKYTHAIQILKDEEAAHRNKIKKRKARKVAKTSRKANR